MNLDEHDAQQADFNAPSEGCDPHAVAAAAIEQFDAMGRPRPEIGIVLGSGLGPLADRIENAVELPTSELPGYPPSTVEGHAGALVAGRLGKRAVWALKGRIHGYEGHDHRALGLPAWLFAQAGAKAMVVTNAAGGVDPDLAPGSLVLISDHLNLSGRSPLTGSNDQRLGPRFPDQSEVWSVRLRQVFQTHAKRLDIPLSEGVYAGVAGPEYETPAEVRMLRALGASLVGMSTVPEAIAAAHAGLELAGISVVTNHGAGIGETRLTHEEVLQHSAAASQRLVELVSSAVDDLLV